jgi:hypothetical protein
MRGRGSQVFTGAVDSKKYGLRDIGVCTRRFEGRHIWSSPRRVVEITFFG